MSDPTKSHARRSVRRDAAARASRLSFAKVEAREAEEVSELVHELRVHEIELEMQNDELRQAQEELERSRRALLASNARYRSLYDFSPAGYLTLDHTGTIVEANLRVTRMLGAPRSELIGRRLVDLVTPADQARWPLHRRAASPDAPSSVVELAFERPDGSRLHAELALEGERESERGSPEIRVALLDVSARQRTEMALRIARIREVVAEQHERRELSQELHGEVEQALALVTMKVAALQETHPLAGIPDIAADLADIHRRIEVLGDRLCPTTLFDLGLVAAAHWLAEDVARRHGLRVLVPTDDEIEGADEVTRITLFRTLRELLLNVVQHAQAEDAVVRVWRDDSSACVEVADRGAGFDPRQKTDGLGLMSARQRIEQLGGFLGVRSRRAEGTQVLVSLPLRISDERLERAGS